MRSGGRGGIEKRIVVSWSDGTEIEGVSGNFRRVVSLSGSPFTNGRRVVFLAHRCYEGDVEG